MRCPIVRLEESLGSPAGALLQRVADFDFMLEAGFRLGPEDITIEEFRALRIVREEREKFEQERSANG